MLRQDTVVDVTVQPSGHLQVVKFDVVRDQDTGAEVDRGDVLSTIIEPGDFAEADAILGDLAPKFTGAWAGRGLIGEHLIATVGSIVRAGPACRSRWRNF